MLSQFYSIGTKVGKSSYFTVCAAIQTLQWPLHLKAYHHFLCCKISQSASCLISSPSNKENEVHHIEAEAGYGTKISSVL